MDRLRAAVPSFAGRVALVAVVGTVLGALTSVGQGTLPFELSPLANSSGSWSLAAFVLASVERVPVRAAILGSIALVALLAGYVLATILRGFPVGTTLVVFWSAAAVVAGPALGVGAAWLQGPGLLRRAAGMAALAGVLLGEAIYGLTVIADTTPRIYWTGQLVVAAAVVLLGLRRVRWQPVPSAVGIALSAIAAGAFYVLYSGQLIGLL